MVTLYIKFRESQLQQHGIKYFACRRHYPQTPRPLGWGQWVKIPRFQNMVMFYIKLKTYECSNMVANLLPADPPPATVGMVSIVKNSTFSEHGHGAYQIKWNHEI